MLMKKVSSLSSFTPELEHMVTFYLGCSFGFESALTTAGVPVRNVEQGRNVSMYKVSPRCGPGLYPHAVCAYSIILDVACVSVACVCSLKS